jgi:alkyldihydroxyacetonephosphate synthase
VWAYIAAALGRDKLARTPPSRSRRSTSPSRLGDDTLAALQGDRRRTNTSRPTASSGPSTPAARATSDLLALRAGELGEQVPDAVVYPGDAEEVRASSTSPSERVALIPFGGGSSVVGGVTACAAPTRPGSSPST